MTITFKSRAGADLLMFGEDAKDMMRLMEKDVAEMGIVTVASIPMAIQKLREAADNSPPPEPVSEQENTDDDVEEPVTLAQRVFPLLDLLERSLKAKVPVVWGM